MLSIYNYSSPSDFLKDRWEEKKKTNPAFSMRAWAKNLGLKSNAPLSLMLRGERPIPKKYLPEFAKSLGLNHKESIYLETLIDMAREKQPEARKYYFEKLKHLNPQNEIHFQEVDTFNYLSNPLNILILEMIDLKDFKEDPAWIKLRLNFPTSVREIKNSLKLLIDLKLLKRNSKGQLVKTHGHISSKQDIKDLGVQSYHKATLDLAKTAIENQQILEREFNSYTFNIRKKDLPKAKKALREFVKDFMLEFEASSKKGDTSYQLSSQLFKMTK